MTLNFKLVFLQKASDDDDDDDDDDDTSREQSF